MVLATWRNIQWHEASCGLCVTAELLACCNLTSCKNHQAVGKIRLQVVWDWKTEMWQIPFGRWASPSTTGQSLRTIPRFHGRSRGRPRWRGKGEDCQCLPQSKFLDPPLVELRVFGLVMVLDGVTFVQCRLDRIAGQTNVSKCLYCVKSNGRESVK